MKSIKLLLVCFCILCPIHTYASVKTFTRTEDNLLIPNGITVSENNKNDILNTPAVSSSEKIYDLADLLSDDEESKIYKQLLDYIQLAQIDSVIVTVNDLKGFTIDSFANSFYRYNGFNETGVIFVISSVEGYSGIYMKIFGEDKKINMIYDDSRKLQLLRVANDYYMQKDYYGTIDSYLKSISGFYHSSEFGFYEVLEDGSVSKVIPWMELFILTLSLTFIVVLIFLYRILHKTSLKYKDDLAEKIDQETLLIELEKEKDLGVYNLRKK